MELKTYFAQDRNGSLIPSATVSIYLTGTNTLASGLTTVSNTPLANPFTADADGKIQFRAPDGIYDMQVSLGSTTGVKVTFQCVDVEQQLVDANSAAGRAEDAQEAAEQALADFQAGSADLVKLSDLASNDGAKTVNTDAGESVQAVLDANFQLFKKMLAVEGYNLVDGSFSKGATVSKKYDAVWNIDNGKFYTYTGTLPHTVAPGDTPASGWSEITYYNSFVVGNDPSTSYYDFSQLSDALIYISGLISQNKLNDQSTFKIVVPAGTHSFGPVRIRGANLSNLQIWTAGSASTTIVCTPNNTTDGIWWSMRFSSIADLVGFRLVWASSVTSPTDKATACQRWYGSGSEPWAPAKTSSFFDILGSYIGRMSDIKGIGDTNGGIRLGSGLNLQSSTIHQIDNVEFSYLRDAYVLYNGCVVGSGYGPIKGTQVYNFIVNHESTFTIREAAASAYAATATETNTGSVFIDTFRGYTSIAALATGGSVTRFDTLFLMDVGEIVCKIPAANYSYYGKYQESFASGNKLSTLLSTNNADILLSQNKITLLDSGVSDQNATSRRFGVLTYTGNGAANQDISVPAHVVKVTIRNRTTDMSITLILNQVVLNANGTNCAWLNPTTQSLRVYTGNFNTSGVTYDVVWER